MNRDSQLPLIQPRLAPSDNHSPRPEGMVGAACDADGHCVTCSDAALPARVMRVDAALGLALVEVNGGTAEVDVTLVDEVHPGQLLLVHGGVAIASLEHP